jgi:myo-inositol 2-dehydrogenase/D-chiro-inositol 1-dehydrogenase
MDEPLRLGFLGCGHIARAHLANLASLGLARPRAYADLSLAAAEHCLAEWGGAYATTDPDRLLADPAIDAVVVATPDARHADQACQVLASGKHLFLEKPMALTVGDAERVAVAAARARGRFMLDLKFRFAPTVAAARRFVPRPQMLVGQAMGDPEPAGHWRLDPTHSAGVVYDLGPHLFDLLYWLAGEAEPVRVYAEGGALRRPGEPLVDSLIATIRFANEARATAILGNSGQSDVVSKWLLEVFGGDRSATIHGHGQEVALRLAGGETLPANLPADRSTRADLKRSLQCFLTAVSADRPPPIGAADGLRVTRLIEATLDSAATGRPIALASSATP